MFYAITTLKTTNKSLELIYLFLKDILSNIKHFVVCETNNMAKISYKRKMFDKKHTIQLILISITRMKLFVAVLLLAVGKF